MNRETQFTARLRKEIKLRLPKAITFKFNSIGAASEGGIPDLCIVLDRKTLWVEVKLLKNKPEKSPLQLEVMRRLGRACYVIWDEQKKLGDVFWADPHYRKDRLHCGPISSCGFDSLVTRLIQEYVESE